MADAQFARLTMALDGYYNTYRDLDEPGILEKFLTARPQFQVPVDLVPMDEYEQRLDLAERIQTLIRSTTSDPTWKFNATQFAALLVIPVARLRKFAQYDFNHNFVDVTLLQQMLNQIGPLVHHFLQKPSPQLLKKRKRQRDDDDDVSSPATEADTQASQGTIRRNQTEVERCRLRDGGLCIVTGTDCPAICHIIPFAWNHSANSTRATRAIFTISTIPIFCDDSEWLGEIHGKLFAGPGSSDKSWNMLLLSHSLHKWWSKGYFGLKYLGTMPSPSSPQDMHSIELQFRWLPRSQGHPRRAIELQEQRDTTKGMIYQLGTDSPKAGANFCDSNRPICSGHTFQVHINQKGSPSFIAMIKLQWAILQVAAMSGAAQAPELLQGRDPDPDPADHIRAWLGSVSAGVGP